MKVFINKCLDKTFVVFNYLFMFIYAFACFFPLYYIVINAISDPQLVASGLVTWYPKKLDFSTLIKIFQIKDIGIAAMNTIIRTGVGTIFGLISSSIIGYIFSKHELKHRTFWYRYFILLGYFSAGLIPGYLNTMKLGMLNSFFWIYLSGSLFMPPNLVITKTYMESLPPELEEAAYIDGAGYAQRFLHVVLPLSKPILATTAVFVGVGHWNDYFSTILYMTKGGNQTLQALLFVYLNKVNELSKMLQEGGAVGKETIAGMVTPQSVRFAMTTVIMIPILFVYPFAQKHFAKGIMMGAVKG